MTTPPSLRDTSPAMQGRLKIICYLGMGSNLENPHEQIARALQTITRHPSITLLRQSPWYASKAIGLDRQHDNTQPDYINGVIEIETTLSPTDLLRTVQQIETAQGRTREARWGARTLDIDILLYGDQRIQTAELEIPHPRMLERPFVLVPLSDLNPKAIKNETITTLLATLPRDGLRLIHEAIHL